MYRPTIIYTRSACAQCIPAPTHYGSGIHKSTPIPQHDATIDGWIDSLALTPTLDDCRVKLRTVIEHSPTGGTMTIRNVDIATSADLLLLLDALCCTKYTLFNLLGVRFTDLPTIRWCLAQWAAGIQTHNRTGICITTSGGKHYWDVCSYVAGL